MAAILQPLGFIGEAEGIETGVYPRRWDCQPGDTIKGHTHGCAMPRWWRRGDSCLPMSGMATDTRSGRSSGSPWTRTTSTGLSAWRRERCSVFRGDGRGGADGDLRVQLPWDLGICERSGQHDLCASRVVSSRAGQERHHFGYLVNTEFWQTRDRNAGIDPRLAGVHYTEAPTASSLQIDLPSAGDWKIRLAAGDAYAGGGRTTYIRIVDTATPVLTIDGTTSAGARWFDAGGTERDATSWVSSNAQVTCTFATTMLLVSFGDNVSKMGWLAHLELETTGAAPPAGAWRVSSGNPTRSVASLIVWPSRPCPRVVRRQRTAWRSRTRSTRRPSGIRSCLTRGGSTKGRS